MKEREPYLKTLDDLWNNVDAASLIGVFIGKFDKELLDVMKNFCRQFLRKTNLNRLSPGMF